MARVSTLTSDPVEIPHEPGNHMRFRVLPWHVLRDARAAKLNETLEIARGLPGTAIPRTDEEREKAVAKLAAEASEHPSTEFDQAVLLEHGLAEWSGPLYTGQPSADELDEVTALWAADEIARRSRPSTAALGKGSSPSTAS